MIPTHVLKIYRNRLRILNPRSQYELMHRAQGGVCFHCFRRITPTKWHADLNPSGWTRDHLIPQCRGGKSIGNVVLSCRDCNSRKSDAMPDHIDLQRCRQIWAVVGFAFPQKHGGHA